MCGDFTNYCQHWYDQLIFESIEPHLCEFVRLLICFKKLKLVCFWVFVFSCFSILKNSCLLLHCVKPRCSLYFINVSKNRQHLKIKRHVLLRFNLCLKNLFKLTQCCPQTLSAFLCTVSAAVTNITSGKVAVLSFTALSFSCYFWLRLWVKWLNV